MFDWTKLFDEGAEAGLDGLLIDSCPYAPGSLEHVRWCDGWRCADDGTSTVLAPGLACEEPELRRAA